MPAAWPSGFITPRDSFVQHINPSKSHVVSQGPSRRPWCALLCLTLSLSDQSLSLRPLNPRGTVLYSWALSLSHEFHPQSPFLGRDQGSWGMRPIAILLHPPRDERRKHSMCRSTRHNQSILWILVLDLVVRLLCLHEHHDATRVPTAIAEPGPFVHLLR